MSEFFRTYIERLQELYDDAQHALSGLPPEALDWVPGPEMNSLTALVAHTAGSQKYWIGDVAAQVPTGRDREAEFRTRGLTADALQQRLTEAFDFCRNALAKLTAANLDEKRIAPSNKNEYSVAWALLHALEHTALHVGQMQLTRQLWEQRPHQ